MEVNVDEKEGSHRVYVKGLTEMKLLDNNDYEKGR